MEANLVLVIGTPHMELTKIYFAAAVLTVLLSGPTTTAQSPPAPILPLSPSPAPAPAPAPDHVNLTELLTVAGPFGTFLAYLQQTRVIDTFQNQANNSKQGITIFAPKDAAFARLKSSDLASLSEDQLRTLCLYHAFSEYYSLADFRNLSRENPVVTFAGGQYTVNVTEASGLVRIFSTWSSSKLSSSVYSTKPVAVYQIDRVLLPLAIFSADPPLAPAPAPVPEASKPSDLKPSGAGSASAPKSSDGSNTGGSLGTRVGLLNWFVLVVSAGLVLSRL